jgi:hypothetical protein
VKVGVVALFVVSGFMMIMIDNKDIRKIVCKFTGGCTIEEIGPSAEKEQETLQKAEAASPPKPTSTLPSPTSPGQTTPSSPIEREPFLYSTETDK